jgi:hypothetical protein
MSLEGIVSKRADAPYAPGNRGLWLKVKCLHREVFVVIGWTDPEGSRPCLGALLLAYYDPNGSLVYAGRVGSGINTAELQRLWRRLQPLATEKMPLDLPPPRSTRFGSPLVLSRVRWVRPSSWWRSSFSPGPRTICSDRSSTKVSARTSRLRTCGVSGTTNLPQRPADDAIAHCFFQSPKCLRKIARSVNRMPVAVAVGIGRPDHPLERAQV